MYLLHALESTIYLNIGSDSLRMTMSQPSPEQSIHHGLLLLVLRVSLFRCNMGVIRLKRVGLHLSHVFIYFTQLVDNVT